MRSVGFSSPNRCARAVWTDGDCLDTEQPELHEYYLKPIPTVWTVFAFAGIWTEFNGDRGTKSKPIPGPHLVHGFLTTAANAVVAPIHPKAMPVIRHSRRATNPIWDMSQCPSDNAQHFVGLPEFEWRSGSRNWARGDWCHSNRAWTSAEWHRPPTAEPKPDRARHASRRRFDNIW